MPLSESSSGRHSVKPVAQVCPHCGEEIGNSEIATSTPALSSEDALVSETLWNFYGAFQARYAENVVYPSLKKWEVADLIAYIEQSGEEWRKAAAQFAASLHHFDATIIAKIRAELDCPDANDYRIGEVIYNRAVQICDDVLAELADDFQQVRDKAPANASPVLLQTLYDVDSDLVKRCCARMFWPLLFVHAPSDFLSTLSPTSSFIDTKYNDEQSREPYAYTYLPTLHMHKHSNHQRLAGTIWHKMAHSIAHREFSSGSIQRIVTPDSTESGIVGVQACDDRIIHSYAQVATSIEGRTYDFILGVHSGLHTTIGDTKKPHLLVLCSSLYRFFDMLEHGRSANARRPAITLFDSDEQLEVGENRDHDSIVVLEKRKSAKNAMSDPVRCIADDLKAHDVADILTRAVKKRLPTLEPKERTQLLMESLDEVGPMHLAIENASRLLQMPNLTVKTLLEMEENKLAQCASDQHAAAIKVGKRDGLLLYQHVLGEYAKDRPYGEDRDPDNFSSAMLRGRGGRDSRKRKELKSRYPALPEVDGKEGKMCLFGLLRAARHIRDNVPGISNSKVRRTGARRSKKQ